MTWYVYVLLNDAGVTYTGIAKDVTARLKSHNAGNGAKFTRGRGPWRPIHIEGPMDHGDALRREIAIKRDAGFKSRLRKTDAAMAFYSDATEIPAVPGAYVLLITLAGDTEIHLARQPAKTLAAGRYLYCGSARGPGGLRARIARHLRRDKTVRWHVDQLTSTGQALGAWVFPDGDECALTACLANFPVPIPGFGSSDCRSCRSHLLAWPQGMSLPAFSAGD
ncbi:DUF123 domain-containing protein [Telmatospirillum sp.]|uniref:DUF123 domain-containing protein n=1 Tax=Telmatospirillum sp. TaxID=2079197 RepID=UPI00284C5C2E|nr:DUF123 domain-containing protein [Telmatospirillum sp.]MDR3439432.1 DUF123 domain-containing protein [Telmatospirillum sp.]